VDLPSALEELPEQYAAALRLRLAGATDEAVAVQIGIDADGVPSLMRVASAKLATLLTEPDASEAARALARRLEGDG
jgi:DNA-directed RNA polymerase specialized sigma24 family protein